MKVLIVDDSLVFRSQIKVALSEESDLEVVGVASNGKVALDKLKSGDVDLVTLDLEMPEMNGLETIQAMQERGIESKIIVFSSISTQGSKATLDALNAGAHDFVTKPGGEDVNINNAADKIKEQLLPKIRQFLKRGERKKTVEAKAAPQKVVEAPRPALPKREWPKKDFSTFIPSVVVIGSSTGGPPALEKIFSRLSPSVRVPILIAQHMPPVFTASLAKRLEELSGILCSEPRNGETIEKGRIYIAPGDFHFRLRREGELIKAVLDQDPPINYVRPAVDPLFESAARLFGPSCAAFVLTGMGQDGQMGCVAVKESGGGVFIQDEESCVVYGMPAAVHDVGAFDREGDLNIITSTLDDLVGQNRQRSAV